MLQLPRLYCIIDAACIENRVADVVPAAIGRKGRAQLGGPRVSQVQNAPLGEQVLRFARQLLAAGATLIQYRNKQGSDREILRHARELRRLTRTTDYGLPTTLVMNDRPDLALAAAFNGIHVGQDDLSPAAARRVIGAGRVLGVSTHNLDQFRAVMQTDCDYVAIGPVFATAGKQNPDPVIGLDGVRAARTLLNQLPEPSRKPLVAVGGITRANCAGVISAGADGVAVISDLLHDPQKAVREFIALLG